MSDYLNDNPNVVEENDLPSRKVSEDDQLLMGSVGSQTCLKKKRLLLKIDNSGQSSVQQAVELLDKMLLLNSAPELTSDEESVEETDGESLEQTNEEWEPVDAQEIYDLTAHISDPEHPLSLGQLSIVNLEDIEVHDDGDYNKMAEVIIRITPTITHCSLATLIGLGIRVRLERALPPRYRFTILLKKGSHTSENQVNKQLNDKERVAAACENEQLLGVVSKMLSTCK
ncbi:iron-sulfur cluster assembly protein CIA2 KNAG_0H03570 [Huiozyma naganishii CBS 8797]|uniref:Uncharacterized protein n=1 Tax=Huiozyma naganishii (strain ATCC MYA-139 / BCRC 22969 / CBS 8797 / KCTC 17520 / NBRC 10181 / NCYC 3082 / Yp74L-3) TaxID=1071383 RepID=J7S9X4_HUIN7|nr:hypothetical protein KNAG_0H03570 [Kazachstania naganishii CBS 8797]CCK71771.1 hypothetical protein KNAG_0H03570 [Kazachstania naganishii CBS 8797]